MGEAFPQFSSSEIVNLRPSREPVDPQRPYAMLVEEERSHSGDCVDVATLFLTNPECPFRCLMCDLWKHTLVRGESVAAIPEQIKFALDQLPPASQIKLYNSGNFFDTGAILREQYVEIAELVKTFDRVIVENHPKLCGPRVVEFQQLIAPAKLEVAMGLETCHPELLHSLNKGMTLQDFERAVEFLRDHEIDVRTFILLRPPFQSEAEGVEWAIRSVRYAFDRDVGCCAVIPTRVGNGIMEQLQTQGDFQPPTGFSMETVLQAGLEMQQGRVFMDLWDAEQFFHCQSCRAERIQRLHKMNLTQQVLPPITCHECQ